MKKEKKLTLSSVERRALVDLAHGREIMRELLTQLGNDWPSNWDLFRRAQVWCEKGDKGGYEFIL